MEMIRENVEMESKVLRNKDLKNKGLDRYNEFANNINNFFDIVNEKEKNTKRITIKSDKIRFIPLDNALRFAAKNVFATVLNVEEQVVEDTCNLTNILVKLETGEQYLLGSSTLISLKERIGIHGKGLEKLTPETLCRVFNERFLSIKENVNMIISYGKIRAIMSSGYTVIKSNELFKAVLKAAKERFENVEFVEGYIDHTHSTIKVLFPKLEKINEIYSMSEQYTPGLVITTSDTGYSANKIGPYWQDNDGYQFINSDEYIYRQHKGNVSLEDLLEQLPNIFCKYQNILLKFTKLMQIEIEYPITVLKKISTHLSLGTKIKKVLLENFKINYQNINSVTAYDLCREILELNQYVSKNKTDFEEKIGKAINLNYARFDVEDE